MFRFDTWTLCSREVYRIQFLYSSNLRIYCWQQYNTEVYSLNNNDFGLYRTLLTV